MRTGADPLFRLHVVSDDPLLSQRLSAASRRYEDVGLTVSGAVPVLRDWDVLVIPASLLFDARREPGPGEQPPGLFSSPVVCYGSAAFLEPSFLAGCRDYLREPWDPEELFLRARRLVFGRQVRLGELEIDLSEGVIRSPRADVLLSTQERVILSVLARNAGTPVPREVFFQSLWGSAGEGSRVLDVHVSSIRRKLSRISNAETGGRLIETCRGKGYRLRTPFDSVPTGGP